MSAAEVVAVRPAVRALLAESIEYARMVPMAVPCPGESELMSRSLEYAFARSGPHGWLLGRFVLPTTQLAAFDGICAAFISRRSVPWRLSAWVPAGEDITASFETVARFNAGHPQGEILVDQVELRARRAHAIDDAMKRANVLGITPYVELPASDMSARLLERIAANGGRVVLRVGGADVEPAPTADVLASCLRRGIRLAPPLKVSGAIGHVLTRGVVSAGDTGSGRGPSFGFLNMFLGCAAQACGLGERDIAALLDERSVETFTFEDDAIAWRGKRWSTGDLAVIRSEIVIAFAARSFWDPVDELRRLAIL